MRAKTWVCPWGDQTLAPLAGGPMYTVGLPTQDGVNLGTAVRTTRQAGQSSDGVEPGHTPRPRDRSKGAHAVEFSKTVAPLQEGASSSGARPGTGIGSRGGPMSIARRRRRREELSNDPRAQRRSTARARGRTPGLRTRIAGGNTLDGGQNAARVRCLRRAGMTGRHAEPQPPVTTRPGPSRSECGADRRNRSRRAAARSRARAGRRPPGRTRTGR